MATTEQDPGKFTLERAWDAPPEANATEEEKAYYVLSRYAVQNAHYNGLYQQWIKPIYFLVGKHWIKWNQTQARYDTDTDVPPWRQQPVTNWTYAVFRTLTAKLTKQRATIEVVPPSGDSEDREAAKLGEAIVEYLWRYLKKPKKVVRAIGWLLATGNVAFNVDWDPSAGELRSQSVSVEVPHPDFPNETIDVDCACDENGEPARREPIDENETAIDGGKPYDTDAEPDNVPIGEILFDVVDPLSYRWNPEATSEDDAEEFFEARMWPRRAVATEFDLAIGDIESGGGEAGDERESLDDMLSAVTGGMPDPFNSHGEMSGSSSANGSDRVLVIKYYRKANVDEGFPEGRHFIIAGSTKVWPKEGDANYPNGEAPLPFGFWPPRVAVIDCPIPGQPQGLGVLSQVVPLNEKYNYIDGKIGEYHTTMAMGGVIWVAPEDRGISITSEPGQVKVSRAYGETGKHPIRERLEALPSPIYEERSLVAGNINTIASVSQLDMGQRPEGVSAGRAFLVIQEASDAAIMPTLQAMEDAFGECGRRELVIAKAMYGEERTIKIRGEKGQWEFHSFSSSDLRDGMDVRAQAGSSAPWSKSAQWDAKLSLLEQLPGLVVDATTGKVDREQLGKFLDSGASGLAAFESDEDPDLVEIQREHAMFEQYDPTKPDKSNQLPQLAVWQNQVIHQAQHFEFMKRDFGRFSKWSPAARMAFIEHMRMTTEAVEAHVAATMGGLPGGAGPVPPGPPAPGEDAPPGAPVPAPTPGGGPPLSSQSPLRLTRGDLAAAGQ